MFDLAKFEELCGKRDYLSHIAQRHMGTTYQWADVEDAVSAGILAAWQYRDRVETSTKGFTIGCVIRKAALYCEKDILRRLRIHPAHDYQQWGSGGSLSGNHMMTRDERAFIDKRTPESELFRRERFEFVEKAIGKLHRTKRQRFNEFIKRDFKNYTHGQECDISRTRAEIRKILVEQKGMKAAA